MGKVQGRLFVVMRCPMRRIRGWCPVCMAPAPVHRNPPGEASLKVFDMEEYEKDSVYPWPLSPSENVHW